MAICGAIDKYGYTASYDFDTKLYVTEFESLREMSRQLNLSSTVIISRKIVSSI